MSEYPYEVHLLVRLVLALGCGFVLGCERERHGISAGLRTNMLVCLGSALMVVISKFFVFKADEVMGNIPLGLDPTRIAAQIVTGVGFLGAGVIIKDKGAIRGLTTAATLWFNAGVGMALGAGMVVVPLSCTALALISLTVLKRFHRSIRRDLYRILSLTCQETEQTLQRVMEYIDKSGFDVERVSLAKVHDGLSTYKFTLKYHGSDLECISCIRRLAGFDGITKLKLL